MDILRASESSDYCRARSAAASLIPRCKNISSFLSARPEIQSCKPPITCTLEDGSRVFLKRNSKRLSRDESDCSITDVQASSSRNLLSKSMKDLHEEAKTLQIMALASKGRGYQDIGSDFADEVDQGLGNGGIDLKYRSDIAKGTMNVVHHYGTRTIQYDFDIFVLFIFRAMG